MGESVEPRVDFIADYTLKSLRLKPDKWQRMFISDEQRTYVMQFIEKGNFWIVSFSYVGKHPTPRGGRDFENFQGGEYFFENFLEGDRFFILKGGDIPYNSSPKFQNFPEIFQKYFF